jgi:hypothetical protein
MSAIGDTRARSLTHPPSEREPPSPARDLLHGVPKLLFTVTETSDPGSGDSVRRIGEAYGHTVFATRNAVTQNPAKCSPAEALELRFIRLPIATMLALTIMSFAPAVQASTDPEAASFNSRRYCQTCRPIRQQRQSWRLPSNSVGISQSAYEYGDYTPITGSDNGSSAGLFRRRIPRSIRLKSSL